MQDRLKALDARLRSLEDRIAVQDKIWAALISSDLGEFEASTACYSEDATVDLVGYDPVAWSERRKLDVREFRRGASTFLAGFGTRQHQATNFRIVVDGDVATTSSQIRAIHVLDGDVWEAHATYVHGVRRVDEVWKISILSATIIHQSGKELIEAARAVVALQNAFRTLEQVA